MRIDSGEAIGPVMSRSATGSCDDATSMQTAEQKEACGNGAMTEARLSFADPDYGSALIQHQLEIKSHPTWSLEENQSPLTGWCGMAALSVCAWLLIAHHDPEGGLWQAIWPYRLAILLVCVFLAMASVELVVFKTYNRHFDFTAPRFIDGKSWGRIGDRYLGLLCCLTGATIFFLAWQQFFSDFIQTYWMCLPIILLLAVPYFWMVEKYARQDGPIDELLVTGRCLKKFAADLRAKKSFFECMSNFNNPYVDNLARGFLVKCIFIPFMVGCYIEWWHSWETDCLAAGQMVSNNAVATAEAGKFMRAMQLPIINLIYCVDLTIALIGYIVSVRILDTQFTSSEPTRLGWFSALICYAPFGVPLLDLWVWQKISVPWPENMYVGFPVWAAIISGAIIFFDAIYSWATVAFGLRFSNLSNRGIIANGPYRIVRHPAYLCKNAAFWLGIIPGLTPDWHGGVAVAGLLCINGIYALRALTEERHLMREPHYQEYCRLVKWRFIPGIC